MLVLTRHFDDDPRCLRSPDLSRIKIGGDITVTILRRHGGGRVSLGVEAPDDVVVDRAEVRKRRDGHADRD